MGHPANLYGLSLAYCDPLVLGVRLDGRPLHGLTAHVDWRIGGRLSDLVRAGWVPAAGPLLLPGSPVVPAGRLVLWAVADVTPAKLAAHLAGLEGACPGLCPADLDLDAAAVRAALGPDAVLFTAEAEPEPAAER